MQNWKSVLLGSAEFRQIRPDRHCRLGSGTVGRSQKNDVQTKAYGLSPWADSAIASLSCLPPDFL